MTTISDLGNSFVTFKFSKYKNSMPPKIRKEDALEYHEKRRPGKIEVVPTKETKTQRDLALAYSPGVAEPCKEIQNNPADEPGRKQKSETI